MDSLPTELLESIVRYFTASEERTHDAKSLSQLCRVSRRLYRVVQPHLYKDITLHCLSERPKLLVGTLRQKPHLAGVVQELFIEFGTTAPSVVVADWIFRLRQVLRELLPLCGKLVTFKSDHHSGTTALVEFLLYKQGGSYYMSIPTDLRNLRTLELFASKSIYRYNYILRLPQLERLCLDSCEVFDLDHEDHALPDDWGWTSSSLRQLILRPVLHDRLGFSRPVRLRSNELKALSSSMPRLEFLRIEHLEATLNPVILHLAAFFEAQLSMSLRQLELCEGRHGAHCPRQGAEAYLDDGESLCGIIRSSALEYLMVDFHTLLRLRPISAPNTIQDGSLPKKLRHLFVRYVETFPDDTKDPLKWDLHLMVQHILTQYPSLKKVTVQLRLAKEPDSGVIQAYEEEFHAAGIDFNAIQVAHPARKSGSITCSGR